MVVEPPEPPLIERRMNDPHPIAGSLFLRRAGAMTLVPMAGQPARIDGRGTAGGTKPLARRSGTPPRDRGVRRIRPRPGDRRRPHLSGQRIPSRHCWASRFTLAEQRRASCGSNTCSGIATLRLHLAEFRKDQQCLQPQAPTTSDSETAPPLESELNWAMLREDVGRIPPKPRGFAVWEGR